MLKIDDSAADSTQEPEVAMGGRSASASVPDYFCTVGFRKLALALLSGALRDLSSNNPDERIEAIVWINYRPRAGVVHTGTLTFDDCVEYANLRTPAHEFRRMALQETATALSITEAAMNTIVMTERSARDDRTRVNTTDVLNAVTRWLGGEKADSSAPVVASLHSGRGAYVSTIHQAVH